MPTAVLQLRAAPSRFKAWQARAQDALSAPVDNSSIILFRIAFGAVMLWEAFRYLSKGWVYSAFVAPTFHFTYFGFSWVEPLGAGGMQVLFLALGALAFFIMIGLNYRAVTPLFFLGITYVFLLDQATYLNHLYLICLVSLLLAFIPAHRGFSVDAWFDPTLRSTTAPAWTLWLLRFQIGIVYVYGGIAKLNADWLRGEPMGMWLTEYANHPVVGGFFLTPWAGLLFSYGGLLLDLFLIPALLWKRTRMYAFAAAVAFHVINSQLFQIGVFPWLMIGATLLFFPPEWPRKAAAWLRPQPVAHTTKRTRKGSQGSAAPTRTALPARLLAVGVVYVAIQLLLPLRHLLYPGDVNWTEEGHRFSWHMKLRDKQATASFALLDPVSGRTWTVDPATYLNPEQTRKMAATPDMILQFAQYLAAQKRAEGFEQIQVRVNSSVSLNGRPEQPLIDPTVDLAKQPRTLAHTPWVLPLEQPLHRDNRWTAN